VDGRSTTQRHPDVSARAHDDDADWCRRTLERIDDAVVLVEPDGTIAYANAACERLFGFTPREALGRNAIDLVHPEDLPRALENLAYAAGADRVEVPVAYRLRGAHGWETFEMRGRGAGARPGDHLLMVLRETGGSELVDDLLDALATGADEHVVHTLVARQLVRRLWGNQVAVRYVDAGGAVAVAHTGLAAELVDLIADDGDLPWTAALERDEMVAAMEPEALEPALRDAVVAAGFGSVIAVPVASDGVATARACLVSFGPADLKPNLGFGVAIDRCRRLLRLALQHRAQRDLLERSARTDPLTGIANRRRFLHQLDDVLARLRAAPEMTVSVAFADLDGFKPVNDRHGHLVGDRVLRTVAERLHQLVSPEGIAARFGGDEFALVALGRRADVLVEAVRAVVSEPIATDGSVKLRVTASVGAVDAVPSDSTGSLLEVVDALCNRDKQARRARR
jgi:diguanylate cyclase (GGDEF)-like protein/PAS domain S-box-containing protein